MEIKIGENESGQRLDRFLRKRCRHQPEIALTDIYAWIRKWACRINGKKSKENYRLEIDDILSRHEDITEFSLKQAAAPKKQKIKSYSIEKIKQMIVFEDAHWIVWNKPGGIVTHPWTDHLNDMSLHDIMQSYLAQTRQKASSTTFNPSFCFRLDKDTSGIIISAKSYEALQRLNEQIRERKVQKTYLAIVCGKVNKELRMTGNLSKWYDSKFGVAKMYIDDKEGKESLTIARPLEIIDHPELGFVTLLEVDLHTGRMHQIRTHLSEAGYPILGDLMYGNAVRNRLAKKIGITRQLLHSANYSFMSPFSKKKVSFSTDLPEDFTILFPHAI
jgi:23S rRNA pseudouridine955/2504/2580 synthase